MHRISSTRARLVFANPAQTFIIAFVKTKVRVKVRAPPVRLNLHALLGALIERLLCGNLVFGHRVVSVALAKRSFLNAYIVNTNAVIAAVLLEIIPWTHVLTALAVPKPVTIKISQNHSKRNQENRALNVLVT